MGTLRLPFWILLAWSAPALLLWERAAALDLGNTDFGFNIYYYLVLQYEPIAWFVMVAGLLLTCGIAMRGKGAALAPRAAAVLQHRFTVPSLALVTLCALALGNSAVYHRYPFSMDEFAPLFQAKIFLSGAIKAVIPESWRAYEAALTPVFIRHDPVAHTWTSSYLPVHAALQALFLSIHASDLLNPLLGAVSVLLVADVARRALPDQPLAPVVGAVLLGTSTQFLLNSISYYSMPAHLCANLLWLSLYLRNTRWSLALLPVVGGLALGVHQLVVHALFVFPFLLRLVWSRRIAASAYCAAVYLGFIALWLAWQKATMFDTPMARAATMFSAPSSDRLLLQMSNLTLMFSWQSAGAALLSLIALAHVRQMPTVFRDLLLGLVATLAFYAFYHSNQGHGWGYRYMYGVLGNLVLLAVFGWTCLGRTIGMARSLRLLAASSAVALLLQIPLRSAQAEQVIRPFAAARDYLEGLRDPIVLVDYRAVWYGQDLVRNDPFLAGDAPIMMHGVRLSGRQLDDPKLAGARRVSPVDFHDLGMIVDSDLKDAIARKRGAATR